MFLYFQIHSETVMQVLDDERKDPVDFGLQVKGQGQVWDSACETLWAQYRLQIFPDHFQTSNVRCL